MRRLELARQLIASRKFIASANNLRRDLPRETIIASALKYSVSHFIDCDAAARRLCESLVASGNAADEMGKIKNMNAVKLESGARARLRNFGATLFGVAFFLALFRFFTPPCPLRWRNHLPGAIVATIGWLILQRLGALYVDRVIARGSALYGALGAIFGLLAFLYIATYVVLLAAELSAVAWERRNPPA